LAASVDEMETENWGKWSITEAEKVDRLPYYHVMG
jgi:hypothetical protein